MTLIFIILFFLICFVVPSVRTYKKTGLNPIVFTNTENAHDLIGFYMKIVLFLILLSGSEKDHYMNFEFPKVFENSNAAHIGMILMVISLCWIAMAQLQMANSWRIGIDEKNKTELTANGLFRFSRNPIYVGMISAQIGFFLYHSSYLNLIILICAYLLTSIQVRLEEEYLLRIHGQSYLDYKSKVSRWLLF